MQLEVHPAAPAWFRYRDGGEIRLGILDPAPADPAPRWVDAGAQDVPGMLRGGGLRRDDLAALLAEGRPMPEPKQFAPVLPRGGKILCLLRNYAAHAAEMGSAPPPEPVFFAKLPDSLQAHREPVVIPSWLPEPVEHEVELGVVLGFADPRDEGARDVSPERAAELVAGYTIVVDVTARGLQARDKEQRWPWLRSKALDTFCPAGPWVVPAEALDPADLRIVLTVDGEPRQDGRTSRMIHRIPEVLAALSRYTTLRPGDLIATGTPEGVGPLCPGQEMVASIEGIGTLRNPIRSG